MKKLHIKPGEYIYFTERTTNEDVYKILLLDFDEARSWCETGIFDFTNSNENNDMQSQRLRFGERTTIFAGTATINALRTEHHGLWFAVSAMPMYLVENDFVRRKTTARKA